MAPILRALAVTALQLFFASATSANISLEPTTNFQSLASNEPPGGVWAGVAQSFAAPAANVSFAFYLSSLEAIDATYTVGIYAGDGDFTTPLLEVPLTIDVLTPFDGAEIFVDLTAVDLVPGSTYTVLISLPSKSPPATGTIDRLDVFYSGLGNPYPDGRFWFFGASYDQSAPEFADRDLAFRVVSGSTADALTSRPYYLTRQFETDGLTNDTDSLITRVSNTEVYSFFPGGFGQIDTLGIGRNPVRNFFDWGIDGNDLVLTFNDGTSGVSTRLISPFIDSSASPDYEWFRDTWGQTTADLFLAVDYFSLVPAGQFEVEERIESIRIMPAAAEGEWILETRFTETLLIPDQVFNAAPAQLRVDQMPTSAVSTRTDTYDWRRYSADLFSNYTADDIVGAWALPMYLDDPGAAPSPPTSRNARFFEEKVTFLATGTAVGDYSGKAFDWSLSTTALTLTSGTETFRYRLLAENLGAGLFSLSYFSSDPSSPSTFELVGRGGKFQASGVARAQNFSLQLPQYYQSLLIGEPVVTGGVLQCEGLSGWTFVGEGLARQFFGCPSGSGSGLRFNPDSVVTVDNEEVRLLRSSGSFAQERFLQILSENDDGTVLALERFGFWSSFNSASGAFDPDEVSEGAAPRFVAFRPFDLSLAGSSWETLDLDGDGLNSLQEDQQGTSYIDPDTDDDGVPDNPDQCQGTVAGASVDASGCADAQKDTDGDGVTDDVDFCPSSGTGAQVNAAGCTTAQLGSAVDTDGDGIPDAGEAALGTRADLVDTDGDGASDLEELETGTDPTNPDDVDLAQGLDIILIKAAIDEAARE